MDPASIIGTTSAVIAFIDFIGKAISTVRELHDAQGTTAEYRRLEDLASDLHSSLSELETGIQAKRPVQTCISTPDESFSSLNDSETGIKGNHDVNGRISPPEESLLNVLRQSIKIEEHILQLTGLQATRSPRRQHGTSGADRIKIRISYAIGLGVKSIRIVLAKKEADGLKREFHQCTTLLNIHLSLIARSEILAKIDDLIKHRLPAELKNIQQRNDTTLNVISGKIDTLEGTIAVLSELRQTGVDDRLSEEEEDRETWLRGIRQFKELFDASELTLRAIGNRLILDRVKFSDMESRGSQIEDGGRVNGTFEWVLRDKGIPESHESTLDISFREWLARGDGIFHFAGKPGSGKSTLMAFLTGDEDINEQLRCWEADDDEEAPVAVVAPVFLWNSGSKDQKSMNGVYRTLLYSILDQHREVMIPFLFGNQLALMDLRLQGPWSSQAPRISNQDVEDKFLSLISDQESKFRFCLFIDGADEFDDALVQKWQLAGKLRRWCEQNPKRVKICVSSREEEPWSSSFPISQRIHLHLTTRPDVCKMVTAAISDHPQFKGFEESLAAKFIDDFVDTAEGVFLWVKFVLPGVVKRLDYHKDIGDLIRVVNEYPRELDDLFDKILSKVTDMEAWDILNLMVTATEQWPDSQMLSLLHYSFVKDVRPGAPCEKYGVLEDNKSPDLEDGPIRRRVEEFKRDIPLLFGGLVSASRRALPSKRDYYLSTSLSFAHRSVYQYMSTHNRNCGRGFDDRLIVMQCLVAEARVFWHCHSQGLLHEMLKMVVPWIMDASADVQQLCFPWLEELDRILLIRQNVDVACSRFSLVPYWESTSSLAAAKGRKGRSILSIFARCAAFGFYQYIDWVMDRSPWCFSTGTMQLAVVDLLLWQSGFDCPKLPAMLGLLLFKDKPHGRGRIDPNAQLVYSSSQRFSIWQSVLFEAIRLKHIFSRDETVWRILAIFLDHGARADMCIWWTIDLYHHGEVLDPVTIDNEVPEHGEENRPGPELKEFDPTAAMSLGPSRDYRIRLRSIEMGYSKDNKDRVVFQGATVSLDRDMAVDITTKLPKGGSLKDIFSHFGPGNRSDILELLNAKCSDETEDLQTGGGMNDEYDGHDVTRERFQDKVNNPRSLGLRFNYILLSSQLLLALLLFGFWVSRE